MLTLIPDGPLAAEPRHHDAVDALVERPAENVAAVLGSVEVAELPTVVRASADMGTGFHAKNQQHRRSNKGEQVGKWPLLFTWSLGGYNESAYTIYI